MSRIVVTMNLKDYGAFTAVAKHPHTAKVLLPKLKPKRKYPPAPKTTIRERILAYVAENPGCRSKQIRRNVIGTESIIVAELKAMRGDETLRVEKSTTGGRTMIHHYPADTTEHQEAA